MNILPQLCLVGVVAAGIAFASPAHAQTIRSYGDQSSSSSSDGGGGGSAGSAGGAAWYPGMPQPSSGGQGGQGGQAGQQQAAGEQGQEGEGEELTGTYRIRMYGGSTPSNASGPRTTLDLAIDKMYRGVIPGKRDEVEHLNEERQKGATTGPNRLTWLGFQPEESRTRIFIQTSREVDYEQSIDSEEKTMTLTLEDTKLSDRNFSRFIDTSYFNRNVQRIEAKKSDGAIEIMIRLETVERPTLQQDGSYLYLDFPHESDTKKTSGEQTQGQ